MKKLLSILCSLATMAFASSVWAITATVTSTGDDGSVGTLRRAIADAGSGDTINIPITGTIVLTNGELSIGKDLSIVGPGPASLTVQRSTDPLTRDFRIFHVTTGNVRISGMTISNGRAESGGGVQNENSLSLSLLILSNVVVSGNIATIAVGPNGIGGGVNNLGTMDIYDSTISTNRADGGAGGGLYNAATLSLTNCTVSGNSANGAGLNFGGGGICNSSGGTVTLDHSTIVGNTASGNAGPSGATAQGGGLGNYGTAALTLSTVTQNQVIGGQSSVGMGGFGQGGGIFSFATLYVDHSTVSGNSAVGGSSLSGNGGLASGGGIANDSGNVIAPNSTISGNFVVGGAASPGNTGGLAEGGGLVNAGFGSSYVTNSTLSGNLATGGSGNVAGENHGGAVANDSGSVALIYSTIASNSVARSAPDDGGGVYNLDSVEVFNAILAANSASFDFFNADSTGSFSDGHSLIGTTNGPIATDPTDQYNVGGAALKLGPLQDNGGPTFTHALLCGSLAIDAGDNTGAPPTDQRDFTRIVNGVIDIGAFESTGSSGIAAVTVTKSCPANAVPPGGLLTFSGTVSNAGDITLTNVTIVNDRPAQNTLVTNYASLAAGQSMSFTGSYTVPLVFTDCTITDTLIANTGESCAGGVVSATNSATCPIAHTLTLECPASLSLQCFGEVPPSDATSVTVTSTAGGAVAALVNQEMQTNGCAITVTRVYGAIDHCGNSNSCTQTITVIDTMAPNLSCANSKTIECGTGWNFDPPSATDNCDGANVTVRVASTTTNQTGFCGTTFSATRIWEAYDSCLNTSRCSQVVTVTDSTVPTMSCAPSETVEYGTVWTFTPPSASDGCDGANVTIAVVSTTTNTAGFCGNTFSVTRVWSATDQCGNSNTCGQTVTVVDTTPPALTCGNNQTVECGTTWSFATPDAIDNSDGTNVTVRIVSTTTNQNGFCGNTFSATRLWEAYDSCLNTSRCSQVVTVIDSTVPTLSCAPSETVEYGTVWTFTPPSATDGCDGTNVTIAVVSTTTNTSGFCGKTFSATRLWSATDQCGNSNTCSQTVTVVDTTPPALTCGNNQTVECGTTWSFATPDAIDNSDGTNVTVRIVSTTTNQNGFCGNTFSATRMWEAYDSCLNTSRCSQAVTVIDSTVPTLSCAPSETVEYGTVWSFTPPSASDGCDGTNVAIAVVSTTTNTSGFCGKTFSATRLWSATDRCGNSNTCSQTVTVVDTTPPALTCGNNQTVECGTTWSFATPEAIDNSDGTNVTVRVVSTTTNQNGFCGSTFSATRMWEAYDSCLNTSRCSQVVTVIDSTVPTLSCAPSETVEYGTVWSFTAPLATDGCDGTNVTIAVVSTTTNTSGFCGKTFSATRLWSATDRCGNSNTCSETVTVVDTTPPALNCGNNQTVECGTTWSFATPDAIDNSDGTNVTVRVVSTTTNQNGFCGNTFSATRIWEAYDSCLNTSRCSQVVTVIDTTPPQITCANNQVVECGTGWTFATPSVSDVCDPNVTLRIVNTGTNRTGLCGNSFIATRQWEAYDSCLNTSRCTQVVTVVDTTPPQITCVGSQVVECGTSWTFALPSAADICDINLTFHITSTTTNRTSSCGNGFVAARSWEVYDSCLNTSRCSEVVTVIDTTPPQITCGSNQVVECGTTWAFANPSVSDLCDTNATLRIVSTTTNHNGFCGNTFSATRQWEAYDSCLNTSRCSQVVTVADTTVPNLSCSPNLVLECGTVWSFVPPNATDACDGTNLTFRVVGSTTNFTCGKTFSATRVWEVYDSCLNTGRCSQTITLVDTTPPLILCSPDRTVECGTSWAFSDPAALDICDGASLAVQMVSTVTNASCGQTFQAIRTWSATDRCGNSNTCSQSITVVDTTPPNISCTGAKTVECGTTWTFDAPLATDLCDGNNLLIQVVRTETNASCGQTFSALRTWSASDRCGNSNTCSQRVTVVDTTPPTITCIPSKTVDCGTAWDFDAPGARDGCDGTNVTVLILSTTTNTTGFCGNTYSATRTWQATDSCTNSSMCSQTVTVVDTTPPDLACPGDQTVECGTPWAFGTASATDRCDGANVNPQLVSTVTNALCGQTYQALRTWSATDQCGNSNTCTQTITVVDTAPPVMSPAADKTVECGAAAGFDEPVATDLCDGTNVVIQVVSIVNSPICGQTYHSTCTWSATDQCGNSNTCSQTVTVMDTTSPTITCGADKTVACGAPWSFDVPTAADTCGAASMTLVSTVTNAQPGNSFTVTRCWLALDRCGNSARCCQTVTLITECAPLQTCTPPYPYRSTNALTSIAFSESEVMRAFTVAVTNQCVPQQIRVWYNDEHALVLGIRRVIVKTASGSTTNDYAVTPMPSQSVPGTASNPLVGNQVVTGDQADTDVSNRPMFPALFITDVTSDPSSLAGDWQFGGTGIPPHAIFGTWKGAVRTVDKVKHEVTVTPDADPTKNNWNLASGDPVPSGLANEGYGAEVRWNIDQLGLQVGHVYRLYFMVHDGDQNKTGGDSGQGCATLHYGGGTQCAPAPCPSCDLGYPTNTSNPLTSVVFNEDEVLRGYSTNVVGLGDSIRVWYNDEHALLLGVRREIVKTSSGSVTNDYTVAPLLANPSCVTNPAVGDQAATDPSGRPIFPALFMTDITADSTSRAGDWQYGGVAIPPQAVCGTWKTAVRTVNKTVSPNTVTVAVDNDPAKNDWDLAGGGPAPIGLTDQGYGAEARWYLPSLGVVPGHSYRFQFMVHDGDQNKSGGDVGEGCLIVCVQGSPAPMALDALTIDGAAKLSTPVVLDGGQVIMAIEGRVGRTYVIEVSNDLQTWSPVAAQENVDGLLQFVDPGAVSFQQRFYRASFGR